MKKNGSKAGDEQMDYISTRDSGVRVSASQAILQGISKEGGLFVPEALPKLSPDEIGSLAELDYRQTAQKILPLFLTDFSGEELRDCIERAYSSIQSGNGGRFDAETVIGLSRVNSCTYFLELWHGPTAAFKDMALQLLPHLMRVSAGRSAYGKEIALLVATSGDTGKAAMEGFRDVPGTRMLALYPKDGVSPMQEFQMAVQDGENLRAAALLGNFDDAQTAVKELFTDPGLAAELEEKGLAFSSANSINWGRLVPQIVYYFAAYGQLCREKELEPGELVDIAVPTGNFGNILAAWYAKQMGLPVGKLICASNRNHILSDFFSSGRYDKNREFFQTISPSMDILVSSNLERLLFELCGRDCAQVTRWMEGLSAQQGYAVSKELLQRLQSEFTGGYCDDRQTKEQIRSLFEDCGYLCDPHTAVAFHVCEEYRKSVREGSGSSRKNIVVSTANPYKFPSSILEALGEPVPEDPFDAMERLRERTGVPVPEPLASLKGRQRRFSDVVDKRELRDFVKRKILYPVRKPDVSW